MIDYKISYEYEITCLVLYVKNYIILQQSIEKKYLGNPLYSTLNKKLIFERIFVFLIEC